MQLWTEVIQDQIITLVAELEEVIERVLSAIMPHAASAGLKVKIQVLPDRRFDVPANVLDSAKMKKDTGWMSLVSFEEGIHKTWDWFFKQSYK